MIDGGALTTVQDLGRFGYQSWGVPQSGALDSYALRLGNIALGNPENCPGLECTVAGPVLEFQEDEDLCITGGDLGPVVDGLPCPMWRTVRVRRGSVLSFRGLVSGCRAYICFKGGVSCPPVLGSASTFVRASLGGIEGRALKSGDLLTVAGVPRGRTGVVIPEDMRTLAADGQEARVIMGPRDGLFSRRAVKAFLASEYRVGRQADRMGCRLEGPAVEIENTLSIYSEGMPLGGIQVDGQGSPIVLLRDRQTVGGYPVIATVISVDVDLFAQLKPGDRVRFRPVALPEAVKLLRESKEKLETLKMTLASREG